MSATSRSKGARVLNSVALHWITYYGHVHGSYPDERSARTSRAALLDICFAQCHGDLDRALSLIEEIVRAPVPGTSLSERWAALVWWVQAGEPRRYRAPGRSSARSVRACITLNSARGAA